MGLTTANRDHDADLAAAYTFISQNRGCDALDVAGALGSGARYAREIIGLLDTVDLVAPTAEDATRFEVVNDTEDVVAWIEGAKPAATAPASAVRPQGSNPACKCGCGASTNHPHSLFRPGHDARMAGNVARAIAANVNDREKLLATLPSQALIVKADAHAVRLMRQSATSPADGRSVAPKRELLPVTDTVKVGRWSYPVREWTDGTRERNTKRNGSGEWVAI
jgi:hypothetical protein